MRPPDLGEEAAPAMPEVLGAAPRRRGHQEIIAALWNGGFLWILKTGRALRNTFKIPR